MPWSFRGPEGSQGWNQGQQGWNQGQQGWTQGQQEWEPGPGGWEPGIQACRARRASGPLGRAGFLTALTDSAERVQKADTDMANPPITALLAVRTSREVVHILQKVFPLPRAA